MPTNLYGIGDKYDDKNSCYPSFNKEISQSKN